MATRVTDGARRESLFSSRATALVSRVSRVRRSRARALLPLNLKKKRDCSQSNIAPARLAERVVALNPSPYSWIFTSIPAGSRPRSNLFSSGTGGIGVHTEQKCGTKPIRHQTLHFEIDTAQLRSITEIAPTQPFMCVSRGPIRYDFWGGA